MYIEDAVAAIIYNEYNEILLHLRDDKKGIWYPNHWGLFGGAIEKNESMEDALQREIMEEIELIIEDPIFFSEFKFKFNDISKHSLKRTYFKIFLKKDNFVYLKLHEGQEFKFFSRLQLEEIKITPYDKFALDIYFNLKVIKIRGH